ncbi:hypothetical protein [Acidovorax sp.]|nr:hypothetical protein [Acidovorax sp.]
MKPPKFAGIGTALAGSGRTRLGRKKAQARAQTPTLIPSEET